jgi:hypothetical protein
MACAHSSISQRFHCSSRCSPRCSCRVNTYSQAFGHRALGLSREKCPLRGNLGPNLALKGSFLALAPPQRPCVSAPVPSVRTPTGQPLVPSCSLRCFFAYAKRGHTLGFLPPSGIKPTLTGLASRRLRRRHACGLGHLPAPLAQAAGPPVAAIGGYLLRRIFCWAG